ncbi:MAG: hypothetical protein NVSMB68_02030 [Thermoanaerobaculia bacterium]
MSGEWNPLRLTAHERFPAPLATVLLLVFIAATLFTGLHHEPWRDEADAWLAARDLPLAEMVPDWTAHAGTPALWYLVLKTAVHLGLPYRSETIANLIFVWAAGAVLLFFAPLARLTKILLLASYFIAYEYAVIARSYGLAILLIFIAASLFQRRAIAFAVVIALLFNTNVHGAIFAALLGALSLTPLLTARRRAASIAIMLGGALLSWYQLHLPAGRSNPVVMRGVQWNALIIALRDVFLPSSTSSWTALVGTFVIVAVAVAVRRSTAALLLLVTLVATLLGLYTAVWFGGLRASGMILIAVVTSIWIARDVPDSAPVRIAGLALNITLLFSAFFAFNVARTDVKYAFSGAQEMALFIDHRFDGHEIASHGFYQAEALLPYLPQHRFFYIGLDEAGTYLKWNAAMRRGAAMPYEVAVLRAKQHFTGSLRPWLLLLNSRMPQPDRYGFRLLHATPIVVFRNLDERYWLYEPVR